MGGRLLPFILAAALAQSALAARLAVPDAKDQAVADKAIKDLFHDAYAKRTPADKRALAAKLLEQADKTTDDTAAQYVLLRGALDLSAETADVANLIAAADALAAKFEVDAIALKADGLVRAASAAATEDLAKPLAQASVALIDGIIAAEHFELVDRLAAPAIAAARKSADAELLAQVQSRVKDARELQTEFTKTKTARAILATKPEDAAANATVGRFLCLIKGDWAAGLPMLAKGNDASLKLLAGKDLAAPTTTKEQVELGDNWFDLAATQRRKVERASAQARAAYWYQQALPAVTGIQKPRIEKRLEAIKSPAPDAPPTATAVKPPSVAVNLTKVQRDSYRLELKSLQAKAEAEPDLLKRALILISAADVMIKLGDVAAGFAEIDKVMEGEGKNDGNVVGKALIVKGINLDRMNRWKEAEECYMSVCKEHRGSYGDKGCEAGNLIFKHYEALKQADKAIAAKLLVIDCEGSYADSAGEACMWLADYYLSKNDKPQALLYLRKAVEKYHGSYGGYKKKAEEKIRLMER